MRNRWTVAAAIALASASLALQALAQAPAPAAAPATAAAAEPPLRVESNKTLWDLIRSGGWAMWPLGACSVLTLGLVILNFQRVNVRKMVPPTVIGQMRAAAGAGDLQQLWTLSTSRDCLFCRSLASGLRHVDPENPLGSRPKVEAAIAETAGQEESQYAFFVNFLALLTSMSPMWGLLGTVSGMIGAFSKIGAGGMGKPEMLARNIGEALVCTATGLLIAITAMGFYFFFRNMLNTAMKQAEKYFTELLDTLMGLGTTFAAAPETAGAETAAAEAAAGIAKT
jgi:biopolymer transport protein ExbB